MLNEDAAMRDQHLGTIRQFDGDDMTGKVSAYALMALLMTGSVYSAAPAMAVPLPDDDDDKIENSDHLTEDELQETDITITQLIAGFRPTNNVITNLRKLIRHDGFLSPQTQPLQPRELYNKGLTSHMSGNFDEAVKSYTRYLEQKPNDITAQRLLFLAQNGQAPDGIDTSNYAPASHLPYPSVLMQDYVLSYAPARQNEAFNAIEDNAVRTPSAAATAPKGQAAQKWDVWLSTSGSKAKISGTDSSSVGSGIGFNYLWNDRITLGLASRFNTSENKSSGNVRSESKGWTLNPTASIKLTDKIVFGASVAYGQASTEVTKNGVKNADYDAQSYLVSGNLATEMNVQDWIFSPFASMSYYAQRRDAYTDVANSNHSAKTSSLGQTSIGSFVSRQFLLNETTALIPALGLSSTYIFKKIDPDGDNFSARLDGGATLATANGLTVSLQGYYDGIGRSNYEIYGGSIRGALKF